MRRRVLVVDDDSAIRLLVSRMLARHGFDVDAAGDGHVALERCRACRYDLLILDLMMPRLDGIGVIDEVRKQNPPPHIIVMTAAVPSIVNRIPHGAVWKTIGKPFEVQDLMTAVDGALSDRQ